MEFRVCSASRTNPSLLHTEDTCAQHTRATTRNVSHRHSRSKQRREKKRERKRGRVLFLFAKKNEEEGRFGRVVVCLSPICAGEKKIGKNRFEILSLRHVVRAVPRVRVEGWKKLGGRPGPAMRTHAHRAAMGRGAQTGRVRRRDGAGKFSVVGNNGQNRLRR